MHLCRRATHSRRAATHLRHRATPLLRRATLCGDDARRLLEVAQQEIELFDVDDLDFERQYTLHRFVERSAVRLRYVDLHFAHHLADVLQYANAVGGHDLNVDRSRRHRTIGNMRIPVAFDVAFGLEIAYARTIHVVNRKTPAARDKPDDRLARNG